MTTDLRTGHVNVTAAAAPVDADSEIAEIRSQLGVRRKEALRRLDRAKHEASQASADAEKWQRAVHGYERAIDALAPPEEEVARR